MSPPTILISPLNWGFGHAGRMIPLAAELQSRGCMVVFAADRQLLPMIGKELPGTRLVELNSPRIRYSRFLPQYLSIFLQLPVIIWSAVREHNSLRLLARQVRPSVIISDNRFGFFHRDIFSVYITHQLRIPFPSWLRFMEPLAAWLHRMIMKRYDLCLVPDFPGPVNLSGRLSHDIRHASNVHYMGPLSRFSINRQTGRGVSPGEYGCCLILSGPEPQRTMLLRKVRQALPGRRLLVLSAEPVSEHDDSDINVTYIIRPDRVTMRNMITGSSMIIARSGYTSVMELLSLGRGAVLVPTPGQTEQEYIGSHLDGRYGFITVCQEEISTIGSLYERTADNGSPPLSDSHPLLEEAVNILLEQHEE
jgi:hypothetical protein